MVDDAGFEIGPGQTPMREALREALAFDSPPRPHDRGLRDEMTTLLQEQLGEDVLALLRARAANDPVVVDRVHLANVLACESYYVEERQTPFFYTVQKARGQVANMVIRRWFFRDPRAKAQERWDPVAAAHTLMDELAQEDSALGEFIAGLDEGPRADLAAGVTDVVLAFEETWPSVELPRALRSNTSLRATMFDRRLVLTYKVAFKFGQPSSEGGAHMARVVLFDLRPGREYEDEERYSRWYAALLELIRSGVAPKRVVTWYAEDQSTYGEDIDADKLEAAARRVAGGIQRMIALERDEIAPSTVPGWRCKFCALVESCNDGGRWLAHEQIL